MEKEELKALLTHENITMLMEVLAEIKEEQLPKYDSNGEELTLKQKTIHVNEDGELQWHEKVDDHWKGIFKHKGTKKPLELEYHDKWVSAYGINTLNKVFEIKVDTEDVHLLKKYRYYPGSQNVIIRRYSTKGRVRYASLARDILQLENDNEAITYKNGDSYDCRKDNLIVIESDYGKKYNIDENMSPNPHYDKDRYVTKHKVCHVCLKKVAENQAIRVSNHMYVCSPRCLDVYSKRHLDGFDVGTYKSKTAKLEQKTGRPHFYNFIGDKFTLTRDTGGFFVESYAKGLGQDAPKGINREVYFLCQNYKTGENYLKSESELITLTRAKKKKISVPIESLIDIQCNLLTVIQPCPREKKPPSGGKDLWQCLCRNCNQEKIVAGVDIRDGRATCLTCSVKQNPIEIKANLNANVNPIEHDVFEQCIRMYNLKKTNYVTIDILSLPKIREYFWKVEKERTYTQQIYKDEMGRQRLKEVNLENFLLGQTEEARIWFINGDNTDYRMENITFKEWEYKQGYKSKTETQVANLEEKESGEEYITWSAPYKKWYVDIRVQDTIVMQEYFTKLEDAVKARNQKLDWYIEELLLE